MVSVVSCDIIILTCNKPLYGYTLLGWNKIKGRNQTCLIHKLFPTKCHLYYSSYTTRNFKTNPLHFSLISGTYPSLYIETDEIGQNCNKFLVITSISSGVTYQLKISLIPSYVFWTLSQSITGTVLRLYTTFWKSKKFPLPMNMNYEHISLR